MRLTETPRTRLVMGLVLGATMVTLSIASLQGQTRRSTTVSGRVVSDPARDRDGSIKILLYHDMEGLAGQADPETYSFDFPEQYAYGRELLMADVNAVVDGLFAGGADSVFIVDGHGSGNREPDIIAEELDPRAKQIFRDEPFRVWSGSPVLSDLVPAGTYDAVATVGMHGKVGGGGFAAHTTTPNVLPYLNGESITEADNLALAWGRLGVPLIFVTGDDRLREDIRESLSWVEFVVTKKSRNGTVRELLPVDEVHAEMRAKAAVAVKSLREMKAVTLTTPIRAALEAFAPATLNPLRDVPGMVFEGDRATFTAADFRAASDGLWALLVVAIRLGQSGELEFPTARRYHGAW